MCLGISMTAREHTTTYSVQKADLPPLVPTSPSSTSSGDVIDLVDCSQKYKRSSGNLRLGDPLKGKMRFVLISNTHIDFRLPRPEASQPFAADKRKDQGVMDTQAGRTFKCVRRGGTLLGAFPALPCDYGKHHSKGFLVEYEMGLWVIVSTANIKARECRSCTQAIWVQDFPARIAAARANPSLKQTWWCTFKTANFPGDRAHQPSPVAACTTSPLQGFAWYMRGGAHGATPCATE